MKRIKLPILKRNAHRGKNQKKNREYNRAPKCSSTLRNRIYGLLSSTLVSVTVSHAIVSLRSGLLIHVGGNVKLAQELAEAALIQKQSPFLPPRLPGAGLEIVTLVSPRDATSPS